MDDLGAPCLILLYASLNATIFVAQRRRKFIACKCLRPSMSGVISGLFLLDVRDDLVADEFTMLLS